MLHLAFNALAVVALFVLRRRQPAPEVTYRTWGYPVTPVLYLLGAGFFLFYVLIGDPGSSFTGLGLVLLGLPAYFVFRRGGPGGVPGNAVR